MTSSAATAARLPDRRYRVLIDAHFRGEVPPGDERRMRLHLVDCADCRAYYERHLRLALVDPQAALPANERLARGLGLSPRRPAGGRRGWLALAATAATCAVVLLAVGRGGERADPQPRAGPRRAASCWCTRWRRGGRRKPVGAELRADSGLAFAYANIGHKRRLMVFGVDEGRRVYWYHPAWQHAAEDPSRARLSSRRGAPRDSAGDRRTASRAARSVFGVFLDRRCRCARSSRWWRAPRGRTAAEPARPRRGGRDQAGSQPGARPMNRLGARAVSLAVAIVLRRPGRAPATAAEAPAAPSAAPPPSSAARFAIIVGVNQSVDATLRPLRYADDDAAALPGAVPRARGADLPARRRFDDEHATAAPAGGRGGAATRAARPRRDAIEQVAADVARARRRGVPTLVYFVYAGHGNVENGTRLPGARGRAPRSAPISSS